MKTFIVKPVSFACNLRCDYCYAAFNNKGNTAIPRMDENTLQRIYDLIPKKSHIIWHGGEPLLRGMAFYERAMELGKSKNITYSLTTNATLLTPAWTEFFKRAKWNIKFSLDGPVHIHNAHRKYANHGKTFDFVLRGINLAKSAGLNFELNAVVTKDTLKEKPEDFYRFFISIWNKFSFAQCWEREIDGKLSPYAVSDCEFLGYTKEIFDIWWQQDDPNIGIELFESLVLGALGKNPGLCQFSRRKCKDYLSIESNGDIYPCGRYNGIGAFRLGNVNTVDFDSIRRSRKYVLYTQSSRHLADKCKECSFKTICNNACAYERWNGKTFDSISPYCETWHGLLSHVKQKLVTNIRGNI